MSADSTFWVSLIFLSLYLYVYMCVFVCAELWFLAVMVPNSYSAVTQNFHLTLLNIKLDL